MRTLWTGDGILGTLAVGVVSVALLGVVWFVFTVLSGFIIGSAALVLSSLVTVGVAAVGVYYGYSGGTFSLQEACYLLAMGLVTVVFLVAVFVMSLLVLLPLREIAVPTAAAITLGVAGLCLVGLVATVRDRDDGTSWALNLRMTVAMVLLGLCGIGLFAVAWFVSSFVIGYPTSPEIGFALAPVAALAVLGTLARMEYRQIHNVEKRADATVVSEGSYPELYGRSRRIAAHLDVPAPTIAIGRRSTPEAMVVGFRPSNTHLICSTGLVEALDGEELDAVIAHELAHVANRDAMVMTVVSAPVVIVDSYITWGSEDALANLLKKVVFVVWSASRAIVSVLSRTRETVADRTAAQVTGSPAALASALRTLDDRVETIPDEDLRETACLSSLSVVPLDPAGVVDRGEAPEGWAGRVKHWVFSTHPSVETRLEKLGAMERNQ